MVDENRAKELVRDTLIQMLLGGISISDAVDVIIDDMTMDVYYNLFSEKDIEEISHPYRRGCGHYFCNNSVIKSDFCVRKNDVGTLNI